MKKTKENYRLPAADLADKPLRAVVAAAEAELALGQAADFSGEITPGAEVLGRIADHVSKQL
ncbi:MAG: hypothetical protein B9S33_11025 [Pedosphaera sp. Tous-C6FEB]|nr:MAG: hypothetical protein B9S33_11025 [Pedosphaera sp. Tous-C6FEB]